MYLTQENNLSEDATLLNIENLSISTQDQTLLKVSIYTYKLVIRLQL